MMWTLGWGRWLTCGKNGQISRISWEFHGNFHENSAGDRDGLMGIDGVPMGG